MAGSHLASRQHGRGSRGRVGHAEHRRTEGEHGGDQRALVLEAKDKLALRDCPVEETLGAHDVRIAIHTVGICGSDVHYYTHGAIGPFVVREPMILGHERLAS